MSFHDATVPAFLQILNSLSGLLTKAEAHCKAKNIQPDVLLNARLYPDMFRCPGRSSWSAISPARACARLTHSEVPSTPDTEKTFEELRQRLAKTVDYVKSFKPAQFDGADTQGRDLSDGPEQHDDAEGPAISARTSRFRNSTSMPPSPTASCATTASRSASGISWGALTLSVIPGQSAGLNPESRNSGFDSSHRPGITTREGGKAFTDVVDVADPPRSRRPSRAA